MPDSATFSSDFEKISDVLNKMSVSLYGTDMRDDTEALNTKFNSIMKDSINEITDNGSNGTKSFLGRLYKSDRNDKMNASMEELLANQELNLDAIGTTISPVDFITEKYRNRMLKMSEANQISNQLIELKEAKEMMRDAVVSADVNTGRIRLDIMFENATVTDPESDYRSMIEAMEKKLDLRTKIKDFIVKDTLGYGETFAYTIPYHEVFEKYARKYNAVNSDRPLYRTSGRGVGYFESATDPLEEKIYFESLTEPYDDKSPNISRVEKESKTFLESTADEILSFMEDTKDSGRKERLTSDLHTLFENRVTVCTSSVPLPILEDGLDVVKDYDRYMQESAKIKEESKKDSFLEKYVSEEVREQKTLMTDEDMIIRKTEGRGSEDGFYHDTKDSSKPTFTEKDVKDCYFKLIPPTRLFPVEIMGNTLFYIYIQTDDATPLDSIVEYNDFMKVKDPTNKIDILCDSIASRVASKFSQKFVKDNLEFKKTIVSALEYYDMANTKIHFQVIPKEYITSFKINKDLEGHGHSMIEDSLFYAKLYLMLLLFKVMSILTKSNDERINYVRTGGIDKRVQNKVNDMIRRRNNRKITLNDLFSYTSVLNKVGQGSEMYVPLSKNGEKPFESEVVSGQDVALDSPIMESLKNAYILGSGVPNAMMNYLNEADFAKSIETANTKMTGRVINIQIDLNDPITELYRKLLMYSTNMPKEVIDTVIAKFPEPKGSSNIATQELINNFQTLEDFIIKHVAGENNEDVERVRIFSLEVAKMHLPMVNFDKIEEAWEKSALEAKKAELSPNKDDDLGDMSDNGF